MTRTDHMPHLAASPVHAPGHTLRWTTANVDEGLPGTVTPLTWSLYFPPTESTMRDCWVDLGVMPERDRPVPDDVDQRFISVAYGHAIANVDLMGQMAARVPGGSARLMEEQLFGSVQPGGLPEPTGWRSTRRYPFVAAKFPIALRRAMRTLDPLAADVATWWERQVFGIADGSLPEAIATLVGARRRFETVLTTHMVLSMAAQGVMGRVETLAERAGLPGLAGELIKSEQGTAEFDLVRDLWRFSRGEIDLDAFLRSHGYHGAREGLVDSVVWRENPDPVVDLAAQYRTRSGDESVESLVARRGAEHADAVRRLEASLGPARSVPARALVRFASHVPGWRETGRAGILRSVDVARAASRVVGARLADRGVLDDAADVRFLTIDELADLRPGPASDLVSDLVAQRRIDHAAYDAMVLPHVWHGAPVPTAASTATAPGPAITTLSGLGVSGGAAEGVVRVVVDLDDVDDLDEGAVLVCRATDPSWASLFPLAEAVVTDVGSAMSHAAIVCREYGLPAVTGTAFGTKNLKTGQMLRVDGNTGKVTVLD